MPIIMGYILTAKNQITVPKAVQLALDVTPGQKVDYDIKPDGMVIMFAVKLPSAPKKNALGAKK